MQNPQFTISQVAQMLGINVETIRYYERRGLIEQPPKPRSGYRHYSDTIVARITFIKRAQSLGFSLKEIEELLTLQADDCDNVQHLAQHKLEMVESKIDDLQKLRTALKAQLRACQDSDKQASCPLINALRR